MAATTTAGGSQINSESKAHLAFAAEAPTSQHPEVLAWLAEAKRLVAEAEERFGAGQVLPALSSLAAVPPLHRMLVQRCSELLDGDEEEDVKDEPSSGMYL